MVQETVPEPKVVDRSSRTILDALYVHVGASALRNFVWLMSGDGKDFDDFINIKTPGLGSGQVRVAICRPHSTQSSQVDEPRPLVLVLEGGGFVLGQPEDGQKHDRKIAEQVNVSSPKLQPCPSSCKVIPWHVADSEIRQERLSCPSTMPKHRDIHTHMPFYKSTRS